ncbi:hypothetical protein K3728_12790 [Rhodobacteraceae bacterium M385]|nr:hypothetical protein K3728_12790 [Rhodobacteraceae bacterium M385]
MTPPTEKWRSAQLATVEASHRFLFKFADILYASASVAAIFYLVVFARLNFLPFDASSGNVHSTIEGLMAGLAMVSFIGLAIFSGPVALLQWRSQRYLQSIS